ncbi:hypothetical protein AB1Y20_018934 [Prymnesium parvum]|uniref:Ribonuclease n=1 Tax=Prymnesium parvum TaxID=97485 RepID=A0AB34JTJ8_PRYPA
MLLGCLLPAISRPTPPRSSPLLSSAAAGRTTHAAHTPRLPGRLLETHARLAFPLRPIVGVDDAGAGAIAGPIFAAAVLLPPDWTPSDEPHVLDSKKLSAARRALAFRAIDRRASLVWAAAAIPAARVDLLGGAGATAAAMELAVARLEAKLARRRPAAAARAYCLVDGAALPRRVGGRAVPSADAHEACVAAASVVATAARDAAMAALARRHPLWGLDSHGGHPSAAHLRAIARYGPSPAHRLGCFPFAARGGRRLAYHPQRREYRQVQEHLRAARGGGGGGGGGEAELRARRYEARLELMQQIGMAADDLVPGSGAEGATRVKCRKRRRPGR